jgi:hypothetical protein
MLGAFDSQTVQSGREMAELRAWLGLDLERQELQKQLAELTASPSFVSPLLHEMPSDWMRCRSPQLLNANRS